MLSTKIRFISTGDTLFQNDTSHSTADQDARPWIMYPELADTSACLVVLDRQSRGIDHTLDRSLLWSRDADRVTGAQRPGVQLSQLNQPCGLYINDTSTVIVVD